MKKNMSILLTLGLALGLFFGLAVTSFAHDPHPPKNRLPRVRERQQEQQQRIRQGIRSEELTRGEIRSLEKEQRAIQREIHSARADGIVTGAERREIQQDQNQASRHIFRAKHNRRDRN